MASQLWTWCLKKTWTNRGARGDGRKDGRPEGGDVGDRPPRWGVWPPSGARPAGGSRGGGGAVPCHPATRPAWLASPCCLLRADGRAAAAGEDGLPGTAAGALPAGHVIAADWALQPPACSALPAGRHRRFRPAHCVTNRIWKTVPWCPVRSRLIGRARGEVRGSKSAAERASPRPERGGGWGERRAVGPSPRGPGATRPALRLSPFPSSSYSWQVSRRGAPWLPSVPRAAAALRRRRRARISRWWCGAGKARRSSPGECWRWVRGEPVRSLWGLGRQRLPRGALCARPARAAGPWRGADGAAGSPLLPELSLLKSQPWYPDGGRYCALERLSEAWIVRAVWWAPVASGGDRRCRKINAAVNNLLHLKKAVSCNSLTWFSAHPVWSYVGKLRRARWELV